MKKNLSAFLLLMLIFNIRLLGKDIPGISNPAIYSFKKDYPGALHATWSKLKNENIFSVRFVHGNEAAVAYYNEEGAKIAIAKLIKLAALPGTIKEKISSLYKEEEIKSVQELVLYNRTCYYFEIEQNGSRKTIRINKPKSA